MYASADIARIRPDGDNIDQETVNRLVDYATEHGVSYPRYIARLLQRDSVNVQWGGFEPVTRVTNISSPLKCQLLARHMDA